MRRDTRVPRVKCELPAIPPADIAINAADVDLLLHRNEVRDACIVPAGCRSLPEIWAAGFRSFRSLAFPTDYASDFATDASRATLRAECRRLFEELKRLSAVRIPWSIWTAPLPPALEEMKAEDRAAAARILAAVPFDWSLSSLAVSPHVAFEHAVDIFDDLGPDLASKATEEAFEHWFTYLYSTVPLLNPHPPTTGGKRRFKDAELVWQCSVEANQTGVPARGGRAIVNQAYGPTADALRC